MDVLLIETALGCCYFRGVLEPIGRIEQRAEDVLEAWMLSGMSQECRKLERRAKRVVRKESSPRCSDRAGVSRGMMSSLRVFPWGAG